MNKTVVENKISEVVGVAFFKEGRLLICESVRSANVGEYTLIGGGVIEGETIPGACVREIKEEINKDFDINENDLIKIDSYVEGAASDPSIIVNIHVFVSYKEVNVEFIPNKEILEYHWYKLDEVGRNLSSSIREHVIPYAIKEGLMY
jgi:ADP-ribose pyrophosphatase YjhB (NUDIX family)